MKGEKLLVFGCMAMQAILNLGVFSNCSIIFSANQRPYFEINERKRPTIAIDCTIHSREWISPAVCRSFINEYLRCGQSDAENCDSYLLEKFYDFNIFILPMLNAGHGCSYWSVDTNLFS